MKQGDITEKPLVAEEDIICYKHGYMENGNFISSYQNYKYDIGKKQDEISLFQPEEFHGHIVLKKGYHSFSSYEVALRDMYALISLFGARRTEEVKTFIIPKGAYYYENSAMKELVSSNIILKD